MPHWKVQTNHNTEGTVIEADTGDEAVASLGSLSEGDYIRGVTQVEAPTPVQHEAHDLGEVNMGRSEGSGTDTVSPPPDEGEVQTIKPEDVGTVESLGL